MPCDYGTPGEGGGGHGEIEGHDLRGEPVGHILTFLVVKKELPFVMGIMADLSGSRTVEGANRPAPYKDREFINSSAATFFGGQSLHRPPAYMDGFANAKISARLPCFLNASRFAHYIKAIMRDKAGFFADVESVSKYLNDWISQYVLLSAAADQSIKAIIPCAKPGWTSQTFREVPARSRRSFI